MSQIVADRVQSARTVQAAGAANPALGQSGPEQALLASAASVPDAPAPRLAWVALGLALALMLASAVHGGVGGLWPLLPDWTVALAGPLTAGWGLLALGCAAFMLRRQRRLAQVQLAALRQSEALARARQTEAGRDHAAALALVTHLAGELQRLAAGDLEPASRLGDCAANPRAAAAEEALASLRSWMAQVQATGQRLAQTSGQVEEASIRLLAAATEQLRDIRQTGLVLQETAARIRQVALQGQEALQAARQTSQQVAAGQAALQQVGARLERVRVQLLESAQRIQLLAQAAQEMTGYSNLIADSAAAGRFPQAEAARHLGSRLDALQTDGLACAAALERAALELGSGQGGAVQLAQTLAEIDRRAQQMTELIAQITDAATHEATLGLQTAEQIQQIHALSEQGGEGARWSVLQMRELARLADELRLALPCRAAT